MNVDVSTDIVIDRPPEIAGPAPEATSRGFDAKAAATYLDARAEAWSVWPNAQRDRGNNGAWTWLNFNYEP